MEIIRKIDDSNYMVGYYTICEMQDGWRVADENGTVAIFYKKHKALAWTNLHYTCGHLVSEGVRQLLQIALEEKE